MSEPFLAEIRIFAGNFAPRGWAFCNGQLLPIAQNSALFSLIGVTYGGDARHTTALPNMKGRAPMHPGRGPGLSARRLGNKLGSETVTLLETQMPNHSHLEHAVNTFGGIVGAPSNDATLANSSGGSSYQSNTSANIVSLASEAVSTTGGGLAHENMQPYLTLNFIIALVGLFPSRS